jgi:hypothetical protein
MTDSSRKPSHQELNKLDDIETRQHCPILVTGAHRSGTTWAGKMLAANGRLAYISEPLNILHRPGVLRAPTRYWYTYIGDENEANFLPAMRETLAYRYHLAAEFKSLRSIRDILRMGRDLAIFVRGRLLKQQPLLKDPFAVFSAPWFASRLQCKVVIVVRHPLAFASSLKRLNWSFDFSHLLEQPLLMQQWLAPFCDQIEHASDRGNHHPDKNSEATASVDIIHDATLLWNLIYSVAQQYQLAHPHFHIVRHEDLSRDPAGEFHRLYLGLGLDFNKRAQKIIVNSSSKSNPMERSQKAIYAVRLNSQANLSNWKHRLTNDEITHVRERTHHLASYFYPDFSWD